jgi:dienelactone hydrolase
MTTTDIEYEADGKKMIGRLALPAGGGRHPAVLIAHEGTGLDDHQRCRADQLAELGYVAFALDYHGGGKPMTDWEAMTARLESRVSAPAETQPTWVRLDVVRGGCRHGGGSFRP